MFRRFILSILPLITCGLLNASLRSDFEFHDIWMIREEFVPADKKAEYLKALDTAKREPGKCWPCYIVEGESQESYIYLYPMKTYGSLERYFDQKQLPPFFDNHPPINYEVSTLLNRFPEGSYVPNETYDNWHITPHLHFWTVNLLSEGKELFENHMKAVAEAYRSKKSNLCFRTWKVTFGADLPKYSVVLYSKSADELIKDKKEFDFLSTFPSNLLRSVKEGSGILREPRKEVAADL